MTIERRKITAEEKATLLETLKERFEGNMHRHEGLNWEDVHQKIRGNEEAMISLWLMEETYGEPDVVVLEPGQTELTFIDCTKESPKGRRSICYDRAALEARKKHKPENSAVDVATILGVEILTEEQYRALQEIENFDMKTSTWVKTPDVIRAQGGAIFCDRRYDHVFTYHNGADSYYGSRGFRGILAV
ncbi:DUF4256 domain-containing protein [Ornithinibacillus sp. 4-3]|uniref:DUF4256 domain-containing protein n=1 Tax=Ornithinibacillus sp. 4-3 TaxID=3231488 RepID=A0AB39HPC6_9BACI